MSIACLVTIDLKLTESRYHNPLFQYFYPATLITSVFVSFVGFINVIKGKDDKNSSEWCLGFIYCGDVKKEWRVAIIMIQEQDQDNGPLHETRTRDETTD